MIFPWLIDLQKINMIQNVIISLFKLSIVGFDKSKAQLDCGASYIHADTFMYDMYVHNL